MKPAYKVLHGDCLETMRTMPDNSIDSIVTDPPYELGFMGKSWDSTGIAYNVDIWREALRVLKPGGHLVAFSGSRTYHRMAVAIEDAGFQIRDQIMWLYGSGFPKSMDIAKAIDKKDGFIGDIIGTELIDVGMQGGSMHAGREREVREREVREPSETAKQWQGWGTALKPAHEPIVLARKPLDQKTVAANVLEHGTGGLNIDGSRVGTEQTTTTIKDLSQAHGNQFGKIGIIYPSIGEKLNPVGRWPANVIHDGSDDLVELMGEPARFFYCAKASKRDRNEGLDDFIGQEIGAKGNGLARLCATCGASTLQGCDCPDRTYINPTRANHHPTVKPTDLMRYLVKLVTPSNGTVLDPFTGSGSTGKGAIRENFNFIGIEQDEQYVAIANARITHALEQL